MNLIVAPAMRSFVWAFLFVVVLPVCITGIAVFLVNRAMMLSVTGVVTALSVVIFSAFAWLLLRNEISLDGRALTVKAAFYERSVNRNDVVWSDSRYIDISREPEFVPRVRLNGIGLPGYQAGWFRLANGNRVFLLKTVGPVAMFPVRNGEAFLLSVSPSSPLAQKIQRGDEAHGAE